MIGRGVAERQSQEFVEGDSVVHPERFEKQAPPFIMSFCAKFSEDMRSSCRTFNEKSAPLSPIRWPYGLIEALFHGAQPGIRRPGAPIHLHGGQFWNF